MIFFVTPAWRNYGLSEVCFDQRRLVMAALADRGIESQCVVIADDENLDIAKNLDFDIIERDNRWLGRKFNDGIEHALESGAEWIVPIGSDSWIDPRYLLDLSGPRTSSLYAVVESKAMILLQIRGVGPNVLPRKLFRSTRPAYDRLRRGFDASLLAHIGPVAWDTLDLHPLQYIGFRGQRHITTVSKLRGAHGGEDVANAWDVLAERYPVDLVERARNAMATVKRPISIGRVDKWSVRDRLLDAMDRVRNRGGE